jgi:short-subunit dehydrogenase
LERVARRLQKRTSPISSAGQPPVVLITGFADGIGRALAFRFATAGYIVIGVDRDRAAATETVAALTERGGQVRFYHADLADAGMLEMLVTRLTEEFRLDVVIHNAGISAAGAYETIALSAQKAVVAVNFTAPLVLTAGLLRHQRLAGDAFIVFIASLSHYVSYPGAATYAATKDGIVSFARSLAVALAGQGMAVLTVFPGPTRTAHARRYSPDNRREARRMAPETLADAIFRATVKRKRTLIVGLGNQIFAWAGTHLPRLTECAMKKSLFDSLTESKVD